MVDVVEPLNETVLYVESSEVEDVTVLYTVDKDPFTSSVDLGLDVLMPTLPFWAVTFAHINSSRDVEIILFISDCVFN
jgi:hypothetical protein